MNKKILVIGATGLIGKVVAKQLNADGYDIVVMSRNKEKTRKVFNDQFELIEADAMKPETIRYSFTGIDGVFISLPEKTAPHAIPSILRFAKESGVKQLVYISGCTVRKENVWHPMIKGHYEAEQVIESGGIPFTILKLTMVMDMIPRYANNGKPFIIGKQMHEWSWIHTSDIAKMTSAAFANEAAENKKLTLWGNEKCTIASAVDRYNQALELNIKPAKPKPYWMANLLALLVGEKLKYAISIFKYFENHPEEGNPKEAYALLGIPKMSLHDFFDIEKRTLAANNK